jgi:hypothetical protein
MEYQRYLEKSGVVETITKVLAALYELPEKPLDSNEFIRDILSVSAPDDVDRLRKTLTALQARLNQLDIDVETIRSENEFLRNKIAKLEGNPAQPASSAGQSAVTPPQLPSALNKQGSLSNSSKSGDTTEAVQPPAFHFKVTHGQE